MNRTDSNQISLGGISLETGGYLLPPVSLEAALSELRSEKMDPAFVDLIRRQQRLRSGRGLGPSFAVDPESLAQSGWAVVYHKEDDAVRSALEPLLQWRREQAGSLFMELEYRSGEERRDWLARHGVMSGAVDPARVPYYLLLIGSPQRIPFDFSHQLDVEYAVGRIEFDTLDEYRSYAESVVRWEKQSAARPARSLSMFAPQHQGDLVTARMQELLVHPLVQRLTDSVPSTAQISSRAQLDDLLHMLCAAEEERPNLLFIAGHGVCCEQANPLREKLQGAVLCEDWRGLGSRPERGDYLAAEQVPDAARVHGLITLSSLSFSAGTPARDPFLPMTGRPFLAALPKRLLAHPGGGALAWVGHVGWAWTAAFTQTNTRRQVSNFASALSGLLRGMPVGQAMKSCRDRYAETISALYSLHEELLYGDPVPAAQMVATWIDRNDAEAFMVVGDPAVRLAAAL